jgi:hypothetical protein
MKIDFLINFSFSKNYNDYVDNFADRSFAEHTHTQRTKFRRV